MKTRTIAMAALLSAAAVFSQNHASAQVRAKYNFPDYTFTTVKENPITPVKNQASSGTCWSYSTISFVESEIIRINGIKDTLRYPDLSEFYVVSNSYSERATKFVRVDGALGFSAGSSAEDVLHVIRDHGMVPQQAMTGMNYGTELPRQAELDAVLRAYVDAIVKNPNRTLSTAWKRGFDAVLDEYLGKKPESFEVDGKTYTPAQYRDALKFNPDDYVTLQSFSHHPFYEKSVIEVCDNWRWDMAYNVPIDEMMDAIKNAIEKGYTIAWGTDVSDMGFTRDGLAILVDAEASKAGSDQEHWTGPAEAKPEAKKAKVVEKAVSQESRQEWYDNKTMTDDHGMQIFGIAKDQDGKMYYMVKNSWGQTGKYKGIWYASEAFVKGETLDVMMHKDALPKDLRKKLGIK